MRSRTAFQAHEITWAEPTCRRRVIAAALNLRSTRIAALHLIARISLFALFFRALSLGVALVAIELAPRFLRSLERLARALAPFRLAMLQRAIPLEPHLLVSRRSLLFELGEPHHRHRRPLSASAVERPRSSRASTIARGRLASRSTTA